MTDYDKAINDLFNPEQMQEWLSHTPEDFMHIMVHEIRRENQGISIYAGLLKDRPLEFQTALKNDQITEDYCLDVIVRRARLIDRLLDTLRAYAHAREE